MVRSLALSGVESVTVVNRRNDRAEAAAALAGPIGRVGDAASIRRADLVVNATPVGMGDDDSSPFDPEQTAEHAVIADLVYHPLVTPLLAAAARSGRRPVGGLGMLVHQAARAFSRWTGAEAPVAEMAAAARRGLQ